MYLDPWSRHAPRGRSHGDGGDQPGASTHAQDAALTRCLGGRVIASPESLYGAVKAWEWLRRPAVDTGGSPAGTGP